MRFTIYGAGAIGGLIGGRLFAAGHDVTLIARGDHEAAIRRDGLTLVDPGGRTTLPVPVAGRPADVDLRPGDVVILAMKSQGTTAAVGELSRCAPPDVAVACAQNGVENERVALRSFARVYGISVMCPAAHLEPGVVIGYSAPDAGILEIGRYPTGTDQTAERIAGAFGDAGFVSAARDDVMRWKYRKLVLNLGNAVELVCGPGAFRSPLMRRLVEEGEAVLAAAGIDPVSRAEDRARREGVLEMRPVEGNERPGGSTWQSAARGLDSVETDYLNGEIVLLGRLHGVATPANELLVRLAHRVIAEGRPPGSITFDDVLAQLG
ncbi:MAG TPA: 2-dehydropantoate 2-reductase [Acidimicrobiales bacterium]